MSQDPLHDAMRRLPRNVAGAHFTARVLANAVNTPRESSYRRPAYAAALSVMLVVTAMTHFILEHRRDERTRLELVAEQKLLVRELAELKVMASETSGVVYLGGNDEVDLLLDLGSAGAAQPRPAGNAVERTESQESTSGEGQWNAIH